jgi:hypothetical protein
MSYNYYEEPRLEAPMLSEDLPAGWIKCPTCWRYYFHGAKQGCPDCAPIVYRP